MSGAVPVVLGPIDSGSTAAAIRSVDGVGEVRTPDMDGVVNALAGSGVLITFRWADDWLEGDIDWIQSYSAGVDQFPLEALRQRGIVLTSAVGIHDVQVSEHTFGLLLALTRGIAQSVRNQANRVWEWSRVTDLEGMTLGVLGLGVIGEAVARKAKSFGMDVVGTKRSPSGYGGVADEVLGPDGTVEVCRRADVVVVTLPALPETTGIVDREALAALGNGYLISVGRGSVVDQAALVEALGEGGLRGAGLDVFEEEPLPESSPLWDMPHVVITPHLAGASPRYGERLAALFARNLTVHLHGGQWVNRVV